MKFNKNFYHYCDINNFANIKNRTSNLLNVLYNEKKNKIFYKNLFWNLVKNTEKENFYKSYDKDWDFYHKGYIGWHEYFVKIMSYEIYKIKRSSLINNVYMNAGVERERRKKNIMNKLKYIARAKKWKKKGTKKWLKKANSVLILKRYLRFKSKKKKIKFMKKRKINRKKINEYWEKKALFQPYRKKEEDIDRSVIKTNFDHCDPFLPKWKQPRVRGKIKKINLKMERIIIKKKLKKKCKKTGFKKLNIVKKLKKKKASRRNAKNKINKKKKKNRIVIKKFFDSIKKKLLKIRMMNHIFFKPYQNIQGNVVKKYRRRKKIRKRTRDYLPWWFNRKFIRSMSVGKKNFQYNKCLKTMFSKRMFRMLIKPMFKFVKNEEKFRSKPKVYDIRKFELSRVINGFKKRKFYHGRRYTEYNNAKPIYLYAVQETIFAPNKNVTRHIYTKYFSNKMIKALRKKNKKKWIKKIVRPSIFFKQHFKSLKKTFRVREKIRKYKLLTRFRSSTSWIKRSAAWKDFQSKFTFIRSKDKEKKSMRWTVYNTWKKKMIHNQKFFPSFKKVCFFLYNSKKKFEYEGLTRMAPIMEADKDEEIDEFTILKEKKKYYPRFPVNFKDPRKLSNFLFNKFYHEHYTSKERIVSIYKNNKYTFIRKNNYRVPHLFAFMNNKYRVKVGIKKIINFYKELPFSRLWLIKNTEFFYSISFPCKLDSETQTHKINKYKAFLDQSINFFFKKYFNNVLNKYSSQIYSTVEEHNLVKERCLEAYLSRTASRIWYRNKNFFKFHKICKATLNKKYRKVLKRKRPGGLKHRIKSFRTFIGDESFRQVRINTNWHDRIEKRRKHPVSYFLWKHTLTERFSKHHRIYKNRIKFFSLDNKKWKTNDWLGLFHYFRRRIKKRRKKIITKVYFKYPRTSTVRDAKVNLSKGTITYAKKTRTYHGRFLKVRLRWKKTRYRRYLKNYIKRCFFFFNINNIV